MSIPPGVLIGISETTPTGSTHDAQVTIHEGIIGRRVDLIHVYHLWDTAFPNTDEAARTAGGQSILYCWQTKRNGSSVAPTWAQIAAGAEDAVIDANAARIKAMPGAPVYINFQNEPESSLGTPGGGLLGTAADFVSAYRRVVDRFRAAGVTNVQWVVNYMGVMTSGQQANAIAMYPGDSYVDWISFDPYNWAGARSAAWQGFVATVQPWYDWARANLSATRPFMLAEYGTVEDSTLPSLQDSFAGDLALWPASSAATVVSGRARIVCDTASTNTLKSGAGYNFTQATARIYPPAAGGAVSAVTVAMRIESGTSGTFLSMEANRVTGLLTLSSKAGFSDSNQVTLTYDTTAHAWFQLRVTAGVVYWETSPDGTTWTNRRTTNATAPSWLASSTTQSLSFPVKRDSGTVDYAEIDDVSTVATVPTPDANRKAAWFTEAQAAIEAQTFPLLRALVYFDHTGSGASAVTPDGWLLSSSTQATAAYRQMALSVRAIGASAPLVIKTRWPRIWAGNPLRPVGQILRGDAPTLLGPSGIPAPTGDLPGWALIESEGFDIPVDAGNWPTHPHYRPRWRTYSPGTHDTAPGKGLYDAARTTTVAGSCLTANLHYEAGTDDQVVSLQTYSTIADATSNVHAGQTYGRYSICMRATYTGSGVAGAHKVVPLLWPRTLPWPDGGETDFPECAITPTATGQAFVHYANPAGGQDVRTSTGLISDWHVWTTEWKPGLIRVFMDGVQVGNDCITNIPAAEMRWTLQFETQITGLRTATSATDTLTSTAHGYTDGMAVKFEALGAATGVSLGTYYYVVGSTANTFQLSATRGGSPITLGTASGVTVRRWPAPDDSALVEVDWAAMWRYVP